MPRVIVVAAPAQHVARERAGEKMGSCLQRHTLTRRDIRREREREKRQRGEEERDGERKTDKHVGVCVCVRHESPHSPTQKERSPLPGSAAPNEEERASYVNGAGEMHLHKRAPRVPRSSPASRTS